MIAEEKVAEVRERSDIVALIGDYVALKRAGSSFKGLCPFHAEKTPSFHVHPARQFFHCFGCGASGDVISFVSRLEGRSFPEAVRLLAERAGVELPSDSEQDDAEYRRARQRKERLASVMDSAAGYFVAQLAEHPLCQMAVDCFLERAITAETAATFRLGYAPHGWDGLVNHLAKEGWSASDAEELGLIVPRRSRDGFYDRFRHRLMFPITDLHGRIIAFSGRALPDPPSERDEGRDPPAKYVNSPEGPLYHKGDVLYGLYESRVTARREGEIILCEGNFDVVAMHQAGFGNTVAPMGTALTENQAKLLRRFADRAVLVFDGDKAGAKAIRSAYPLLQKVGLQARVAPMPPKADPDSYIRERGAEDLRKLVSTSPGIVEYLIDGAAADAVGTDARTKAEFIMELGPILAKVDNPVEVGIYIERVGRKFGISDLEAVRRQLRKGARRTRRNTREDRSPRGGEQNSPAAVAAVRPLETSLDLEMIAVFLDQPALFAEPVAQELTELLTSEVLQSMFQSAASMVSKIGRIDASVLMDETKEDAAKRWLERRLAIQQYDESEARRAVRDGLPRLARKKIEEELPRLQRSILDARRRGEDELAQKLTKQHMALFRSAKDLMQGIKR